MFDEASLLESSPDPGKERSLRAAAYRSTSAVQMRGCHFLFLSLALPPPSLSLSSFFFLNSSFFSPSSPFLARLCPVAVKGIGFLFGHPLSFPSPSWSTCFRPLLLGISSDRHFTTVFLRPSQIDVCRFYTELLRSARVLGKQ